MFSKGDPTEHRKAKDIELSFKTKKIPFFAINNYYVYFLKLNNSDQPYKLQRKSDISRSDKYFFRIKYFTNNFDDCCVYIR
jgi:hypothetical protein